MTKKQMLFLGTGTLLIAGAGFVVLRGRQGCPVEMPSTYQQVSHFQGLSSVDMAISLKDPSGPLDGTSEDWLFEGAGAVEDAAWPLLLYLRKSGDWRQIPNRTHTVYSLDGKSPMVVMFRDRKQRDRHYVRVNGHWRTPGMYEKALATLPKTLLSRFESKPKGR